MGLSLVSNGLGKGLGGSYCLGMGLTFVPYGLGKGLAADGSA